MDSANPDGNRLQLAAKLANPRIAPAVEEFRRTGRTSAPVSVDLDPTSFCDLACPGCISEPLLNRNYFGSGRLIRLADELAEAGVLTVTLIGGGEPLMHAATIPLIERLSSLGLGVGVVTNGTQLSRNATIFARCLDWVRVSLDAASEETFGAMRPAKSGRNLYHEVLAGVSAILAVPGRNADVGLSFMIRPPDGSGSPSNTSDIINLGELGHRLGVDYLEFKLEMTMDHFPSVPNPDELARVKERIETCQARYPGLPILMGASLADPLSDGPGSLVQSKSYSTCPSTELRTTITPAGVYPCAYHRGSERFSIGDVATTTFAEMWSSPNRRQIDPSLSCDFYCARHESNMAALAGVSGELMGQDHQHLPPGAEETSVHIGSRQRVPIENPLFI